MKGQAVKSCAFKLTPFLLVALALAGCSTISPQSPQLVPATRIELPEAEPTDEQIEQADALEMERNTERHELMGGRARNQVAPDGDDFWARDHSAQFPGKTRRQMEIEKIHRLAKLCIAHNNTSAPCLEIIRSDMKQGKRFIDLNM